MLRLGIDTPTSLDPARASSPAELLVADLLFDGLTAPTPAGGVRAALADRWQASADQRRWDFHLRPGTRFADGGPLRADDVKYTLERMGANDSGASDALVGVLHRVTGVTVPAVDSVHVDLDQPTPELPLVLANPALGVVARGAVERAVPAFAERPVGSGPFRLASRSSTLIRLTRSPGSHALLDGIDLRLGDAGESYARFRAGGLDVAPVPPEQAAAAARRYGSGHYAPFLAVLFYAFNLRSPKFADPLVRQAIVRAIDRRGLAARVYGAAVDPVDGPVPAGVPGADAHACGDRCGYSQARARALLGQAFPAGPPQINVDFEDDVTQRKVATAIKADLARVGVDAVLRPHPVGEYSSVVGKGDDLELFRFGWVGAFAAPESFLDPLFRTGTDTNVSGFSSPEVDGLLRSAAAEPDSSRRSSLYRDAQRRIMAEVPIVPLAQFKTLLVARHAVRGLELDPAGTFDGARVWLAGK